MRGFLIAFFVLFAFGVAFADIPIYCPHCKEHLYNYQKDEIIPNTQILAKDFIPAKPEIPQPTESSPMVCPLCHCPLNQYESWAWERNMNPPKFNIWAISLLTKDEEGNFIGVPYDFKYENWEGKQ